MNLTAKVSAYGYEAGREYKVIAGSKILVCVIDGDCNERWYNRSNSTSNLHYIFEEEGLMLLALKGDFDETKVH